MSAAQYKAKWGYNRGTALRSVVSNEKMAASMRRSGHQPPKWTRDLLPKAQKASRRTNRRGSARLEKRLNSRGRKLAARPQFWKHTLSGDVVSDAKMAQMRLTGMSTPAIAAAAGMTLAPAHYRLKRMGYQKRARVFLHGEAVSWKHYHSLCSDFNLTNEQGAKLLGVTADWTRRKLKPKRKGEALSARLAKRFLKVRVQLLAQFRNRSAGPRGGRPRQLPASERTQLPASYDALHADLKALRDWIGEQNSAPSTAAIWDHLCEGFRAGRFGALKYSPQFFAWAERSYAQEFRSGRWIPHDFAVHFLAHDHGASEHLIWHVLSHRPRAVAP